MQITSTTKYKLITSVVLAAFCVLPSYAADRFVAPGQSLQQAIDEAQPGDTITLQAGATYSGMFRLRKKSGASWITIRTSAMASLPPAGVRVKPSDRVHMPKLVAVRDYPVIKADNGAHHYRLIGLEITGISGLYNWQMIELGYGNEASHDLLPHSIELDRLYIHGDPKVGSKRGITLNARKVTIKNCHISDFKSTWQDSQAIAGWNGPGPFVIENNYLEASGESINFGGTTPAIKGLVPSDITIRRNHLFKPLSWRKGDSRYAGTPWWIKNAFELKNARRVLFEGNIIENVWADQQRGYAVQFTVRTNRGAVPWAVIENVTVRKNIFRHCGAGINIMGQDDDRTGTGRYIYIQNNLFEDINSVKWGGPGTLFAILKNVDYAIIDHNTAFHDGKIIHFEGGVSKGLIFRNNAAAHNTYGIFGAGSQSGKLSLQKYAPGAYITRNIIAGGNAALYPPYNYFPPSLLDAGFINFFGADFRLSSSSPYRLKGTDGKDIGADLEAITALTAGVAE